MIWKARFDSQTFALYGGIDCSGFDGLGSIETDWKPESDRGPLLLF